MVANGQAITGAIFSRVAASVAYFVRFRAAVQDAKIGPDKDIPHISAPIIAKYVSDLRLLGLL
jgi:fatty acid CoA ligase FadD9